MKILNKKISNSNLAFICMITLLFISMGFLILFTPVRAQTTTKKEVLVITDGNDSHFRQSIEIDKDNFKITYGTTSKLNEADIVVVFDAELSSSETTSIVKFVENGGAALVFMGSNLHENPQLLLRLNLITSAGFETNDELMLLVTSDETHPMSERIDWNSAPHMKEESMTVIPVTSYSSSVKRIIDVYPASKNLEIAQYSVPILVEMTRGNGNVLLFTGWLGEGFNKDFKLWPYFNYLLYSMAQESLNESFDLYPIWPYSPVPHLTEQIIILIIIILLAITAFALYKIQRRKSATQMDQKTIELIKRDVEEEEQKKKEEAQELQKKLDEGIDLSDDWEVIGIHRQLGGFLFTLFVSLFLIIPQLIIASFVMPQIIQPYAQAAGMYNYAFNLFAIVWLVFDLGTSFALVKYFAEYRVKNPEKAVHYVQIFVWWQLFTGLAQVLVFAFIGSIIFPFTDLAHMSWVFITYSLIQYPGFFLVFLFSFQGMQKADKFLVSYVLFAAVFPLIGQMIFCALGRMIGGMIPVIGEALGAAIGYSLAGLFTHWVTFYVTMRMFKKLGYSVKTVFRIDFTKEEFKESMSYGWKFAFGSSFVQIVWFLQILITSAYIADYTNELGYYNLAASIGALIQLITLYGQSLVGAYSESHSHEKKTLTKLYVYQGFKWGNFFGYFFVSTLLAIGAKFIIGSAGVEYGTPALKFLVPLFIFHLIGIYSWLVDAVFTGTGHTGYAATVWIIEQVVRAILLIIFVMWLRSYVAVLYAYIPAVLIKGIVAWLIVRYKVTEYKLYPFKAFITPGLAAIVNGITLFFVAELIWAIPMGDKILNTMIIFLLGVFIFIMFFGFLDGLFGGYDDNTLKEFERATAMVKGRLGALPRMLYKSTKVGCRISPFHDKFKISIYEKAMAEATELTMEKRALII